ncbi:MAG: hypothetical protein EOM73_00745 [Bacteroidia bacterium]|nr:hypothetical protein [Bacteroidia bacterium]
MKINRNNFEPYFVDYLEGNLDEKLVDDFIEFLQQNPDLKEELSFFEPVVVSPENLSFNNKKILYKEKFDAEETFNHTAIARLEGDISPLEKAEFENYLSTHPKKKNEAALFTRTKLLPDFSVVFKSKSKLRRQSAGKIFLLWTSRVAAVFIIALAIYTYFSKNENQLMPDNQIAVFEDESPKKEIIQVVKEDPSKKQKDPVKGAEKKEPVKSPVKKTEVKPEPAKSLRETTRGRLDNNLASVRMRDEIPLLMAPLAATIQPTRPNIEIAAMDMDIKKEELINEERFLTDVIKEKTGIDNLSFHKITKAGLSLVSSFSNEKFSFETNEEGLITGLNYESRLLAFSIPTHNE